MQSIRNLSKSLTGLNKSLGSVNASGIQKYANELQKVVSTFDSLNSKTSGLSTGMQRVSESLSSIGKVDFKENGINSFINAMNRLAKIDMSNFDTSKLGSMVSSLSALANIPNVSSGVNRFVSSVTKLAGTGDSIGTVSKEITGFADGLKKATEKMSTVGDVSESVNIFVQAIARLASAGNKTGQTASQLSMLSKALLEFFNAMRDAPNISSDVIRMTEALAQLAKAGGNIGSATSSVSNSFNTISTSSSRTEIAIRGMTRIFSTFALKTISLGQKAAFAIAKIGTAAINAASKLKNMSGIFATISNKVNSLYMRMFFLQRVGSTLFRPIKSAVDYVETLNYFNSAFKQVAENMDTDEWKKSGIKSAEAYADSFQERAKQLSRKLTGFEVSDTGELTRTNTASLGLDPEKTMQYQATFAQMASSMGDTSETALKLSNALTMVGADLASVRNMDFEDVWQDMASGLTGMSRSMDKYGINIRNANMQQELYNLGIDTSISKLSQADKTILRTIILLNNSQYAWGDLANTINRSVA